MNKILIKQYEKDTGNSKTLGVREYYEGYINWLESIVRWNPVSESLPEKGQQVLATYKNGYGKRVTIIASYVREHDEESGYTDDESAYEYCEEDDTYYLKEGWYELIDNWPDYSSVAVFEGEVDYWMQMPEFKGEQEKCLLGATVIRNIHENKDLLNNF